MNAHRCLSYAWFSVLFLYGFSAVADDRDTLFLEALEARGLSAIPIIEVFDYAGDAHLWAEDPVAAAKHAENSGKKLILKGYEFTYKDGSTHEQGPGFVMQHGWTSNVAEFVHYIDKALADGYRPHAFNWPGHGWGPEVRGTGAEGDPIIGNRSYIEGYESGDLRPDFVNPEAAMRIDEIMATRTGLYFSLGHSMGAMFTSAAEGLGLMKHLIRPALLGGPPHFDHSWKNKLFGKVFNAVVNSGFYPEWVGKIKGPRQILSEFMGADAAVPGELKLSRLRYALFREAVMANPMALGFSVHHRDTHDFFSEAMARDYRYKELPLTRPALFIKGSEEQVTGIVRDAPVRGSRAGYQILIIDGVDHLGEVSEKAVKASWPVIHRFFQNFDPEHESSLVIHVDPDAKLEHRRLNRFETARAKSVPEMLGQGCMLSVF